MKKLISRMSWEKLLWWYDITIRLIYVMPLIFMVLVLFDVSLSVYLVLVAIDLICYLLSLTVLLFHDEGEDDAKAHCPTGKECQQSTSSTIEESGMEDESC